MGQVRQQFKANMHELDDDKVTWRGAFGFGRWACAGVGTPVPTPNHVTVDAPTLQAKILVPPSGTSCHRFCPAD